MKSLRRLFCRHYFVDTTTDENWSQGGITHHECFKCGLIISAYRKGFVHHSTWTAKVDEKILEGKIRVELK